MMSSHTLQRGVLPRVVTIFLVLILVSPTLSGCLESESGIDNSVETTHWLPPVEERSEKEYRNDDVFSRVSINGTYDTGEVQSIFVPVPSITASDGGAGFTGGAEVHLGLWLLEKEGCDLTISEVLEECKVPVIAEIGPYYDDGDVE